MARAEARLRRRGRPARRLDCARRRAGGAPRPMIPVLLLLLAVAAVYVGTIETAFSTLMRLSLRLMAERGGRDDRLGYLLRRPHPAVRPGPADSRHHLLAGDDGHRHTDRAHRDAAVDRDAAAVRGRLHPDLRARHPDVHRPPRSRAGARGAAAAVRRRRALRPAADPGAGRPGRRCAARPPWPRPRSWPTAGPKTRARRRGPTRRRPRTSGGWKGTSAGCCSRSSTSATRVVREVMTPRPDIVAIEDTATVGAAAGAVPRAGVLADSRVPRQPRQHSRRRIRQRPDSPDHRQRRRRRHSAAVAAGDVRAGDQAGVGRCSRNSR